MRALTTPDGTPEILALRALKLGDLLVAVPALHALRRGFPDHRLILATTPWLEPIVDLVGGIDALVPTLRGLDDPLPIEPRRVELAVNLHGNGPESRDRLREIAPQRTLEFRVPALDPDAGADDPRPLDRVAGGRHGLDARRVAVVGHVDHERGVTVEEDPAQAGRARVRREDRVVHLFHVPRPGRS